MFESDEWLRPVGGKREAASQALGEVGQWFHHGNMPLTSRRTSFAKMLNVPRSCGRTIANGCRRLRVCTSSMQQSFGSSGVHGGVSFAQGERHWLAARARHGERRGFERGLRVCPGPMTTIASCHSCGASGSLVCSVTSRTAVPSG